FCLSMYQKNKIELLAPAGNREKLKFAFLYGADAVYIGFKDLSLRSYAEKFSISDIKKSVDEANKSEKKIYIALNAYVEENSFKKAERAIDKINEIKPHAVIVSDPGIINLVLKRLDKRISIHLSTQANTLNSEAVSFWKKQGIKRIILGRELSLSEIKKIYSKVRDIEFEIFCHGAMCVSYSGRCLLSSFMTGRKANKGKCAHPCRWKYRLIEEERPREHFAVDETDEGTFIFNSKDLCMVDYVKKIRLAGISAIKVEGRMKSLYYIACVTRAYRKAIDNCYGKENFPFRKIREELEKVSHRKYTTGFYINGKNDYDMQEYSSSAYHRKYDFLGIVIKVKKDCAVVNVRNKIRKNEKIEIIGPDMKKDRVTRVGEMRDEKGVDICDANPGTNICVKFPVNIFLGDIIRKEL
ncbi:MAG: U32 family peptidase, partial [Candidatus Aureabacteria bacterium]|nr:U32 family peptidase [Candidatus Auribacterota bacterium]